MRYILLLLVALCPLWAVAAEPTWRDTICVLNDGDGEKTHGPWYINANRDWETMIGLMDQYEHIIIHLPGGNHTSPMQFATFSLATEYAKEHPDDVNAVLTADWPAFIKAIRARKAKGLWTAVYVGSSYTLKARDGETPKQWQMRAIAELQVALQAGVDQIFFDAEMGPRGENLDDHHHKTVYGVGGGMHLLINYLRRQGIRTGIEPCTFADYTLYHQQDTILTDRFWYAREFTAAQRKELGLPGGGDSRWNTGAHAARPLRHVNQHPRVYRILDPFHDDKPRLLRNIRIDRHVPCVMWLDLYYENVDIELKVPDMTAVTQRTVYTTPVGEGIDTSNPLNTLMSVVEVLEPNKELALYDWSATTVATAHPNIGGAKGWTWSVPATLIGDTFAIGGDHNIPPLGATCYWRQPDGKIVWAKVVKRWQLPTTRCNLLKLDKNPSTQLNRLPICTDTSLARYVAAKGYGWFLGQAQNIRLRKFNMLTYSAVYHVDAEWGDSLKEGGGRPCVVPLTNGELVITGILTTTTGNNRISADSGTIRALMADDGETLREVDLP